MAKTSQNTTLDGRKFLVLDDNVMAGETIRRIGEVTGLESVHTTSHAQFFELINSWSPDVIALDLLMPDMDGVEVIGKLSELGCKADIIITSGLGERVLNAASLSAATRGLNTLGVLSKPFSAKVLKSMLLRVGEKQAAKSAPATGPSPGSPTVADLQYAIETEQITVAYQPKIYCRTGTLAGFEALARWEFKGQFIPPDTFIPLAEDHGLIDDLTILVIEQALKWVSGFSNHQYENNQITLQRSTLSINISPRSLTSEAVFQRIVSLCDEYGIERQRLIFELTESSAMSDAITGLDTLTRLRMQGFQLSIDDFGTGYSSMVQLVRLPFTEIKIDKSFVMNIQSSDESRAITRSIVDLGKSLGLHSTAEGVEDQATLEFLQDSGCTLAQGYYIAKPLKDFEVLDWYFNREQARGVTRLESVRASALFGSRPERRFDRLTHLAGDLLNMPICFVNIVGDQTQWTKSKVGLAITEIPKNQAFCTHTIEEDNGIIVSDAQLDDRFARLELVTEDPKIRFYAGYPICSSSGAKVGALCVMDRVPREFTDRDLLLLRRLSKMVESELTKPTDLAIEPIHGVVSRRELQWMLPELLELLGEVDRRAEVLLFTLDELSDINRFYGRAMGDQCLQAMADIILGIADHSDLVSRYRGSEVVLFRVCGLGLDGKSMFDEFERQLLSLDLPVSVHALVSSGYLEPGQAGNLDEVIEEARANAIGVGESLKRSN